MSRAKALSTNPLFLWPEFPIVLDPKYSGQTIMFRYPSSQLMRNNFSLGRFCLLAETLEILDLGVNIKAPTPQWWEDVKKEVRSTTS